MDRWPVIKSFWLDTNTEEGRFKQCYLRIIWRENNVKIELSERCRWFQVNEIINTNTLQTTHKIFKHTQRFVSSDEETSSGRFSWAANARENLPGQSRQLNSNLPRNFASQLNFVRDSFCCEYSWCRLDQLVVVDIHFYLWNWNIKQLFEERGKWRTEIKTPRNKTTEHQQQNGNMRFFRNRSV